MLKNWRKIIIKIMMFNLTKQITKNHKTNYINYLTNYQKIKKIYNNKLEIIIDDALHYPIWNLGKPPRQIIANLPFFPILERICYFTLNNLFYNNCCDNTCYTVTSTK